MNYDMKWFKLFSKYFFGFVFWVVFRVNFDDEIDEKNEIEIEKEDMSECEKIVASQPVTMIARTRPATSIRLAPFGASTRSAVQQRNL